MTETIVIAELSKGEINTTTNELVSAANLLGDSCTVVVPCTDSSVADKAGKISGVSKVIAAKSSVFGNYDAAAWAEQLTQLHLVELLSHLHPPNQKIWPQDSQQDEPFQ